MERRISLFKSGLLCLISVLGACSSGGGDQDIPGQLDAADLAVPNGLTISYDSSSDTYTISRGGETPQEFVGVPARDVDNFDVAVAPGLSPLSSGFVAYQNRNGSEAFLYVGDQSNVSDTFGIGLVRPDGSSAPDVGSAEYQGDYYAIITTSASIFADPVIVALVTGKADISVSFGLESVGGAISERLVLDPDNPNAIIKASFEPDVTLFPALLNNEGIVPLGTDGPAGSASTTSLEVDAETYTFAAGGYFGMISGADASEFIGGVAIQYDGASGRIADETGVFSTSQTSFTTPLTSIP